MGVFTWNIISKLAHVRTDLDRFGSKTSVYNKKCLPFLQAFHTVVRILGNSQVPLYFQPMFVNVIIDKVA